MFMSGDVMITVPSAIPEVVLVPSWNGDILEVASRDWRRKSPVGRGFDCLQKAQQQL
jgi:hypothetical protein